MGISKIAIVHVLFGEDQWLVRYIFLRGLAHCGHSVQ